MSDRGGGGRQILRDDATGEERLQSLKNKSCVFEGKLLLILSCESRCYFTSHQIPLN